MGSCCKGTRTADTIREQPQDAESRGRTQTRSEYDEYETETNQTGQGHANNANKNDRDDVSGITGLSLRTGIKIKPPKEYANMEGFEPVPNQTQAQNQKGLPPRTRAPKNAEATTVLTRGKAAENSTKKQDPSIKERVADQSDAIMTGQSETEREETESDQENDAKSKNLNKNSGMSRPKSKGRKSQTSKPPSRMSQRNWENEGAIDDPDQSSTEEIWAQLKPFLSFEPVEIAAFGQALFPMLDNESYYMSIFYSLAHLTPVVLYFSNQLHLRELNLLYPDIANGPCAALAQFISFFWTVKTNGDQIDPAKFRFRTENLLPNFCDGHKRDASEFFYFFLDKLEENLLRKLRTNENPKETNFVVPKHFVDCSGSVPFEGSKFWKKYTNLHSNSIVTDIFKGLFVDSIQCNTCSFSRFSFEPFVSIHLDISSAPIGPNGKTSIWAILDANFSKRSVPMYCESCLRETSASIDRKILRLPPSLSIIINRVGAMVKSPYNAKLETELDFDKTSINLEKYFYKENPEFEFSIGADALKKEKNPNSLFNLTSIICHYGAPHNGLYYTACCNLDDYIWRVFTPDVLFELTPSQKAFKRINSDVYMLWYQLTSFDEYEIGQAEDMDNLAMTGNEPESIIQMAALHKFLLPEMSAEFHSEDSAKNLLILMNDVFKKPVFNMERPEDEKQENFRDSRMVQEEMLRNFGGPGAGAKNKLGNEEEQRKDEEDKQVEDAVLGVMRGIVRRNEHPVKDFSYHLPQATSQKANGTKKRVNFNLVGEENKKESQEINKAKTKKW